MDIIVDPKDPDFLFKSNIALREKVEIQKKQIIQLKKVIFHNCN